MTYNIPKGLRGKDLYHYMTEKYKDKDYSSVIALLPYAMNGRDKAFAFLESVIKSGKEFVTIYPAFGEKPSSDMKWIGSIPDGGLYLR